MPQTTPPITDPRPAGLRVTWNGVALDLLPDMAVYRADLSTLYVADVHLGKPEHFRAGGAPVPESITDHDLTRLSRLLDQTTAQRLVILGDLFHARVQPKGTTIDRLARWRERHQNVRVLLVRGNHDRHAGDPSAALCIESISGPVTDPDHPTDPIELVHEPERAQPGSPCFAGHLHPAVRLPKLGRPWTTAGPRSACFWLQPEIAVLPAFGRFTGAVCIHPGPVDRVIVTNGASLIEVSHAFVSRGPSTPAGKLSPNARKKTHAPRT